MSWIQPLSMNTWFISVFAGDPQIFLAIALMAITALSAYFRMNGIGMFMMLGIFLLMFKEFLPTPIVTAFAIFTGLLVGYWLQRLFAR